MKYDGDLGRPNPFVPLSEEDKIAGSLKSFPSQSSRQWFTEDAFWSLLRLRGIECNAPSRLAEAFFVRRSSLLLIRDTSTVPRCDLEQNEPGATLAVIPSDHVLNNEGRFVEASRRLLSSSRQFDRTGSGTRFVHRRAPRGPLRRPERFGKRSCRKGAKMHRTAPCH